VLPDRQLSDIPSTVTAVSGFQTIPPFSIVNVVLFAASAGFTAAFGNGVFATNCSQFESDPGAGKVVTGCSRSVSLDQTE